MSLLDVRQPKLNIQDQTDSNSENHLNQLFPSIIFYSLEKCGSTFVSSILKQLCQDLGMQWVGLGEYNWNFMNQINGSPEEISQLFKTHGYWYGYIRDPRYWSFLDTQSYKKLLVLRDPRDVLTSRYFSFGKSHPIPKDNPMYRKEFLKLKIEALKSEIDDYIIKLISSHISIYEYYIQQIITQPNIVFLTYEQMVGNFDVWLDMLLAGLELDVSPQLIEQIKREVNFTVEREDVYAHKRQVAPGDHRRKLKPETIEILNASFAEILDTLGYPI